MRSNKLLNGMVAGMMTCAVPALAKDFAFFEILKDGKTSKEQLARHCRGEDGRVRIFTYASTNVTQTEKRARVAYKDAQATNFNANPGEWSGELYKALCPGLYSFTVDYTTAAEKGATNGDVAIQLYVWRKSANTPRPGVLVSVADKTGPSARGTGHMTAFLALGTGDEVSTYSSSADGKPRHFERVAITGYLTQPMDSLAEDFDTAKWEAERLEADKARLSADGK